MRTRAEPVRGRYGIAAFSYTCGYNVQSGAMSDLLAAAIAHNPARSAQSKVGGKCEIFGHGRFAAALAAQNFRSGMLSHSVWRSARAEQRMRQLRFSDRAPAAKHITAFPISRAFPDTDLYNPEGSASPTARPRFPCASSRSLRYPKDTDAR